ncbi:MAG: aldehyde dehydrogenase (NADP(+)) [Bacteroidetes bacterium]|nr:MAG: aldehyde dehydrogenase (NADP(+)) [Bacteroidota bacterium]
MNLSGSQLIGPHQSQQGSQTFHAVDPSSGQELAPAFYEATPAEVAQAAKAAEAAFERYRRLEPAARAAFLDQIAEEIMALGDALIKRAMQETALPEGRLKGERGRTCNQLKLFAEVVREGSWVDARIDTADPGRKPVPRPDVRQMHIPLGPVAVFGASNFPLAFSVAGGDTASALAAGCTVLVKGHPAHPGTSELVGRAVLAAAAKTNMPEGVFSLLQGAGHQVGMAMVEHPLVKAVGFTGSFRGGKALFDLANQRPEPIPVYAEMGSTNPVFVLPGALAQRAASIAKGLASSVALGVGQFCTNPGLVLALEGEHTQGFIEQTGKELGEITAGTMLTKGIQQAYLSGIKKLNAIGNVEVVASGKAASTANTSTTFMLKTDAATLLTRKELTEEVFGPSTVAVTASSKAELLAAANSLEGHLTATIHATEKDLQEFDELVTCLQRKVGRLIFNGFPTGVEVCHAMVHGGPFPATTDARSTSVGTAAIRRFARPLCYQDFPQHILPPELQNHNPRKIWRLINGQMSREGV